jgi:hypothetical protein
MATAADIVSRLDDKIYALLNDTDSIVTYRIGDKMVDRGGMLEHLRHLRETYAKIDAETPFEDIRKIALDFDEFGAEDSEWVGDEA